LVENIHLTGSGAFLVTRADGQLGAFHSRTTLWAMNQNSLTLPFANVRLTSVALSDNVWVVWAAKIGTAAACPRCQVVSSARHSSYQRRFWDLPIQGRPVRNHAHRWPMAMSQRQLRAVHLHRSTAWDGGASCATDTACDRHLAPAGSQRRRLGGRRLAARLGFVGNKTTILRHLMRRQLLPDHSAPRVVGLE
jgi:hypothetical protein